jgi:hypothetical protein
MSNGIRQGFMLSNYASIEALHEYICLSATVSLSLSLSLSRSSNEISSTERHGHEYPQLVIIFSHQEY